MKWPVKEIREKQGEPLFFKDVIDLEASLKQRNKEIISVSEIKTEGILLYENHSVLANFQIDLTITLPSSRSLEPVAVPMHVNINELYAEDVDLISEENVPVDVIMPLEGSEVNLIPAIEDNILLNLPVQVFTPEELSSSSLPKGTGWEVITEDAYENKKSEQRSQQEDPRLAKLKALLEDEEKQE